MGQNLLNPRRGGGEPMTLNTIIADLKKSGVNSKLKVISKIENLDLKELQELKRDVQEKINKEKENEKNK